MVQKIRLFRLIYLKLYVPKFIDTAKFIPINGANHNYDSVEHIKKVLKLSLDFLVG